MGEHTKASRDHADAVRVDCPIVHHDGRPCWLCGSVSRAWVSRWTLAQWIRVGRPKTCPT